MSEPMMIPGAMVDILKEAAGALPCLFAAHGSITLRGLYNSGHTQGRRNLAAQVLNVATPIVTGWTAKGFPLPPKAQAAIDAADAHCRDDFADYEVRPSALDKALAAYHADETPEAERTVAPGHCDHPPLWGLWVHPFGWLPVNDKHAIGPRCFYRRADALECREHYKERSICWTEVRPLNEAARARANGTSEPGPAAEEKTDD